MGIAAIPFIKDKVKALTWEQTLNLADLALNIAKKNGRNNWVSLYENDVNQLDSFYDDVMTDLKMLIESGRLSYQSSLKRERVDI